MSLPKYQEYRDSGERWLGAVPAHWDVRRLKNLFEIRKRIVGEEGHQVLSITQRGIKVKDIESNDGQLSMDYSKYQVVKPGDFAMNHMDLLTGFVDISSHTGVTSPDYRVFAIRDGVLCEPKYFLYLLQNGYRQKIFYAFGQGASEFGRWRFPTDQFNDFRFPFPPHEEQTAIAAFLDREIAKIDALIVEQEKLISLLAEKRQSIISQAVTKGLNLDVPMKDSGVTWLGGVPAHWTLPPLYMRYSSELGKMLDVSRITGRHLIPYLRNVDVQWDAINYSELPTMDIEASEYERYTVRKGDLLVCEGGEVGRAAVVQVSGEVIGFQKALHRLRARSAQEYPRYMFYTFAWAAKAGAFAGEGQSTIAHLTGEQLRKYRFPCPPISEQQSIASFLDAELGKLTRLTAEGERAIGLLKERRSALIAAAVTGQIDVRNTMAQLQSSLEAVAA